MSSGMPHHFLPVSFLYEWLLGSRTSMETIFDEVSMKSRWIKLDLSGPVSLRTSLSDSVHLL